MQEKSRQQSPVVFNISAKQKKRALNPPVDNHHIIPCTAFPSPTRSAAGKPEDAGNSGMDRARK